MATGGGSIRHIVRQDDSLIGATGLKTGMWYSMDGAGASTMLIRISAGGSMTVASEYGFTSTQDTADGTLTASLANNIPVAVITTRYPYVRLRITAYVSGTLELAFLYGFEN